MIPTQEILTIALCFVGKSLTPQEEQVLSDLCQAAGEQWYALLRDGVEIEDCRGAFLTASAWTALAAMSAALEQSSPTPLSFSAGDLSVQTGRSQADPGACARSLQVQAQALMAPYTRDLAFAFLGVEG